MKGGDLTCGFDTAALNAHYNSLLVSSRNETIQAQIQHQAWQAAFGRVSENVRLAMKHTTDGGLPYRARIAGLKEENRLLRAKAGWDPPSDDSDQEKEDEDLDKLEAARGL